MVLPLGGNSITHDICDLDVEESEAEQLKLKHGSAVNEPGIEGEPPVMIDLSNHRTVPEQELNDIIEARVEEIVANVWNQIQISGYENQLLAGIVLTGGSAKLKDFDELFRRVSGLDVRVAVPEIGIAEASLPKVADPACSTVVGLLLKGSAKGGCVVVERPAQPAPAPEPAAYPPYPPTQPVGGVHQPAGAGLRPQTPAPQPEPPKEEHSAGEEDEESLYKPKPKRDWGSIFQRTFDKINKSFSAGDDEEI